MFACGLQYKGSPITLKPGNEANIRVFIIVLYHNLYDDNFFQDPGFVGGGTKAKF